MKLLVTGGAGFIGSNFVTYMLDQYPTYKVINVDSLTYAGNLTNVQQHVKNENYTFIQADITNAIEINRIVSEGIDVIVNFAAESHVDRSILEPGVFIQTNVVGTHVLLDAAVKYGVTKFVQISTDEVYGSLGPTGLFTEQTPMRPNSPYSASKAAADLLVFAYAHTYGLPINITRCSNNYGPYQLKEKLIPYIISCSMNDQPIGIYGDGLYVRDWLYVEDHCSAIDLVIHHGAVGEVYNIGGRNEYTNLEVTNTILHHLGKSPELITHVTDRLGHDRRYGIDPTKIMTELNWEPKHTFSAGIKRTIQWYVDNQVWWMYKM